MADGARAGAAGEPRGHWEAVIGLEIHVQLATRAKLFSAAPVPAPAADRRAPPAPNHHLDPVVLGLPGVLPTLNGHAVELALRLALALEAEVQPESRFARKHYFYPDLPKGYQITQGEAPLARGGGVWVEHEGAPYRVPLERLHLEEDAGKSVHDAATGRTLVDFDRAGVALVEVVTAPAIASPALAEAVFRAVREVALAVGASHGDLERGHLRCDANVSVRRRGEAALGAKVEVKNLNSFRFVRRALAFEVARQTAALEAGERVARETRTWDDDARRTMLARQKETGRDYRYLYEPDLMPLAVDRAWVDRVRASLPELPAARRRRLMEAWGVRREVAAALGSTEAEAAYFEEVARGLGGQPEDAEEAAKWLLGPLREVTTRRRRPAGEPGVPARAVVALVGAARRGTITRSVARDGLAAAGDDVGLDVAAWIAARAGQASEDELAGAVARALNEHPAEVASYRAGKDRLLGFFMGVVMRALGGRADAGRARDALRRALDPVRSSDEGQSSRKAGDGA